MTVTIYRQPPLKYRTKYHILLVDWGHVPLVYVQGRRAFQKHGCFCAASSILSLSVKCECKKND